MTLEINHLNKYRKNLVTNIVLFIGKDSKIKDFANILDKNVNYNFLEGLKKKDELIKQSITSLDLTLDKKMVFNRMIIQ